MYFLPILFIFLFGAIIGSFVNVVSLRYNTGLSISKGRSKCFSCNMSLKWYELLPLVSFFGLRGKCRSCKTPISFQYPLVEFLTGLVFVGIAWRQFKLWPFYSGLENGVLYIELLFLYYAFIFSLLMVIAIYDIRHKIIPNSFVYTFIGLALLKLFLFVCIKDFTLSQMDILDILSPVILFLPFAALWFVSQGKWIGFGDAKLAFGIGALLGFVHGVGAIVLAFWIGAGVSLIFMVFAKINQKRGNRINFKTEVPFAPFMIGALFLVFLTGMDVLGIEEILGYLY